MSCGGSRYVGNGYGGGWGEWLFRVGKGGSAQEGRRAYCSERSQVLQTAGRQTGKAGNEAGQDENGRWSRRACQWKDGHARAGVLLDDWQAAGREQSLAAGAKQIYVVVVVVVGVVLGYLILVHSSRACIVAGTWYLPIDSGTGTAHAARAGQIERGLVQYIAVSPGRAGPMRAHAQGTVMAAAIGWGPRVRRFLGGYLQPLICFRNLLGGPHAAHVSSAAPDVP